MPADDGETVACAADLYTPTAPVVTDNCGNAIAPAGPIVNGVSACEGGVVYTWNYTDCEGNSNDWTYTFTIIDDVPPTIQDAPQNATYQCLSEVPVAGKLIWTDNCGESGEVQGIDVSDGKKCPETITRTWSYDDVCGNSASTSQIITIKDTIEPVITLPTYELVMECYSESLVNDWISTASANDNCSGNLIVTGDYSEPSNNCSQVVPVVFTSVDECGNTANVTMNFIVKDNTPPDIMLPESELVLTCFDEAKVKEWTNKATANDNCDGEVKLNVKYTVPTGKCYEKVDVLFSAIDNCGNENVVVKAFTVYDSIAPIFASVPEDITVQCKSQVPVAPALAWTDNCGSYGAAIAVDNSDENACPETITRTWSITDMCGNNTTVKQIITIDDTEKPEITVPQVLILSCFDPIKIEDWAKTAFATDNCTEQVQVEFSYNTPVNNCNESLVVSFMAVDACGNVGTASQSVIINDLVPPLVTAPDTPLEMECYDYDAVKLWAESATAIDNCEGQLAVNFEIMDPVNNCNQIIPVRFWARDKCDNVGEAIKNIVVDDKTAPYIVANKLNSNLGCNPSVNDIENALGIAMAFDNCDTVQVVVTDGEIQYNGCFESKTRTFTATDRCGNSAIPFSVTVTWSTDVIAPVVNVAQSEVILGCNPTSSQIEASYGKLIVAEACSLARIDSMDVLGSNGCLHWKTRTYKAVDACNNVSAPVSVTVKWTVDLEVPTITATSVGGYIGCNPISEMIEQAFGTVNTSDGCGGGVVVEHYDTEGSDGCLLWKTRNFTATDGCGNKNFTSVTVSWTIDTTAPIVVATSKGGNIGCNPTVEQIELALGTVDITDNCIGSVLIDKIDNGGINGCTAWKTRKFVVTDACGNESSVSVTIYWTVDLQSPTITATSKGGYLGCKPSQEVIEKAFGTVNLTDGCSNVMVNMVDVIRQEGCFFFKTRTFIATDECNNKDSVSVTVTWKEDNDSPVLQQNYNDLYFACREPVVIPMPVFADNCGGTITTRIKVDGVEVDDLDSYLFEAGNREVCFIVSDECGNTTVKCITVTVEKCPELYCTLTPEFYGSEQGVYCDGRTTTQLLNDLLSTELMIGCNNHSYKIGAGSADCVIKLLPSVGASAMLDKNYTCDDALKGNTLLGQTVALGLNLRLDKQFGDLTIMPFYVDGVYKIWTAAASSCKVENYEAVPIGEWAEFALPESVLDNNGSINMLQLFQMASDALCNGGTKKWLDDLTTAVTAVNQAFDQCRFLSTVAINKDDPKPYEEGTCGYIKVYPNPFNKHVTFEFMNCQEANAQIEIYNMYGQKMAKFYDQTIMKDHLYKVLYEPVGLRVGTYFYRVIFDSDVYVGKLVYRQ
jgi:hypothetical protein